MLLTTGCTSFHSAEWKLLRMTWISCASVYVVLCDHMLAQMKPEKCQT
jgi:hypothetical protein